MCAGELYGNSKFFPFPKSFEGSARSLAPKRYETRKEPATALLSRHWIPVLYKIERFAIDLFSLFPKVLRGAPPITLLLPVFSGDNPAAARHNKGRKGAARVVSVAARTVLIYLTLIFAMRLMGKRQIGEMQIPELIITLMLSELAVGPISNKNIPLLYAVVPIVLLLSLEVILSFFLTKSNRLKKLLYGEPIVLIRDGRVDFAALSDNRIEIDELLSELRLKGAPDVRSVKYAILEDNGKLSVFLKAEKSPPSAADLGLSPPDAGIARAVVVDGEIVKRELERIGRDETWLFRELGRRGANLEETFLLTVNDAGEIGLIRKEKR